MVDDRNNTRTLKENTVLSGKYQIKSVLGEGGFGITYCAKDTIIGEIVAIKEYFPAPYATRDNTNGKTNELTIITGESKEGFQKGLEKFVDEAANLAKFQREEGIVSVKNFFYENNTAYMVMEYIDGITLKDYLKQHGNKLPYEVVLAMMNPVMQSLSSVHKLGIIHRDISLDNIMVTNDGRMKLIDFGAARYIGNGEDKSITVMLKDGYAPPEQYQTNGKQGPWTDVYALCATMYRMMTGEVLPNSIARTKMEDKGAVRKLKGEKIPKHIVKALTSGLTPQRKKRIQSIERLIKSLDIEHHNKPEKKIVKVIAVEVVIILLLIGCLGVMQIRGRMGIVETDLRGMEENKDENNDQLVNKDNIVEDELDEPDKQIVVDEVVQLSREEMIQKIEAECNLPIIDELTAYEDFDADGMFELFTVTGTGESCESYASLYFVTSNSVIEVDNDMSSFGFYSMSLVQCGRKIIYDLSVSGSLASSLLYTCEGNMPITIDSLGGALLRNDGLGQTFRLYDTWKVNYPDDEMAHTHIEYPVWYVNQTLCDFNYEEIDFYQFYQQDLDFQNEFHNKYGHELESGDILIMNMLSCDNGYVYINYVLLNTESTGSYYYSAFNQMTKKIDKTELGYFDPINDQGSGF